MTITLAHHQDILKMDGIPVIPTNTSGVMGAGLAGQFALHDPVAYDHYLRRCRRRDHVIGRVMMIKGNKGYAICFPTMVRPGQASQLADIRKGADDLVTKLAALPEQWTGTTILIPPLGCGIGRLPRDQVQHELAKRVDVLTDRFHVVLVNF